MAGKYWGVEPGQRKRDVAYDTSTTTKKVEVYVEDGVRLEQAVRSLELILGAMKEKKVLP